MKLLCLALALHPPVAVAWDTVVFAAYNLENYHVARSEARAATDAEVTPKSEKSIAAAVAAIATVKPDILAALEMGDEIDLADFRRRLDDAGLEYPHHEWLQAADTARHLALLSRFPIRARHSRPNLHFELAGRREPLQRGILDVTVEVTPDFLLRVLVVHLKSKRPVPQDEALLRRNEALLVRTHIEQIFKRDPGVHLVLAGDLNDTKNEISVAEIQGVRGSPRYLDALPLADPQGDRWTHYWKEADLYSRIDYLMVSRALRPFVDNARCRIHRSPDWNLASDHRLLHATFRNKP